MPIYIPPLLGRKAATDSEAVVLSNEDKQILLDILASVGLVHNDTVTLSNIDVNIDALKTLATTLNGYVDGIEGGLNTLNGKDFATQTTLAAVLAKIIAAPATEAKQDNIITKLSDMLAEMRDDVFVTAIYWEDRSNATAVFYREERIRNQDDQSVTTVYTRLSDNTAVGSLPAGVVLVQGVNDRTIEAFRYKAIASGTGYSTGDWLTNTLVYDTDGNGSVISSTWYNLSTAASITAPSGANIQAENEAVLANILSILTATYTPITNIDDTLTGSVVPAIGNPGDSAASTDTGTFSLIALFKRLLQGITTIFGNQTNGNQKAIIRAAAKGTTTAADVTSTDAGSNRQPLDVILRDILGNYVDASAGGGGGGGGSTTIDNIDLNIKASLDMLRHPHGFDPALGAHRVIISANGQAVTVTSGSVGVTTAGAMAVDQSFNAWVTNNLNFNTAKNRIYG